MRKRAILIVTICALAALAAVVVLRPPEVTIVPVRRGTAIVAAYATGTVEAPSRLNLKARVPGAVDALLVHTGDSVEAGQLLVRIDADALRSEREQVRVDLRAAHARATQGPEVASLRAQLRSLEAQREQARFDLSRLQTLNKNGAVSAQALDHAQQSFDSLNAQMAALDARIVDAEIGIHADTARQRARVDVLDSRLRDSEVRSPISGVVLDVLVEPGEVVAANQPLLRVADLRHLWIEAYLDEADVGRVSEQTPAVVRMDAFPGELFAGRIVKIAPDADRERKAFEMDIEFESKIKGLRSGMSAEVNVVMERHERALLIPLSAVKEEHVWSIDAKGRVHRRPIRIGSHDLDVGEVLSGLLEGELVVFDGSAALTEGARIRSRMLAPPASLALR